MNQPVKHTPAPSCAADWVARATFFLLMALVMITLPLAPANELDASWRMALGKFFHDGLQFGRDVVFTYGPLGFLMGKTYAGSQFTSLIVWQLLQGVIFTLVIFRQGLRLDGYQRYVYFTFFFVFGITYEDSLHLQVIALVGFELLRLDEYSNSRVPTALHALLLGTLGLFKFTNLMLSSVFVACAIGLLLWRRQKLMATWLSSWYFGSFLLGWVLCRQNPLNLPAYLINSWEISQGYQETMGIPTPPEALHIGLVALALTIAYAIIFLRSLPDKARAVASTLALGSYIFLNWKHGYVRADGHMIGFFYAVLLPATAYPALLNDSNRSHGIQRLLTIAMVISALVGVNIALPGLVRGCLGNIQERFFTNFGSLQEPAALKQKYNGLLETARLSHDLPETRSIVGQASVDMLGYEQGVVLFNNFNYHPRPVFQSYSVYRPHLSKLNADFYSSSRAPEYVLFKLQTIDRRLVTFDDPEVLYLLAQRYSYIHTEKGYQLWHRNPGAFSATAVAPHLLHTATLAPGQPFMAEEFNKRPLWATVELKPSYLGALRGFAYKLPIVLLRVQDTQGVVTEYRMPLPQGRTGFIINPVVDDPVSYMRFAGGNPERLLRSISVIIDSKDRSYFSDEYIVTLSGLTPSTAGKEFFRQAQKRLFHMFNVIPVSYEAHTPLSEGEIDGKPMMVFHAPSELVLDLPKWGTEFTGTFGFMPGAYTGGGNTDGANFSVSWALGTEEVVMFERYLDPVHHVSDRGLQTFKVALPTRPGGRLLLRTDPGPRKSISWDWTAWGALTIK